MTPRPWAWEFFAVNPPLYFHLAHVDADRKIHSVLVLDDRHRISSEDAAFIVKAVNHHEELVEVVKDLLVQYAGTFKLAYNRDVLTDGNPYATKARLLLAKLEDAP